MSRRGWPVGRAAPARRAVPGVFLAALLAACGGHDATTGTEPGDTVVVQTIDLVSIPAGAFVMGDHIGLGGSDPNHPSDEVPLHTVTLRAFSIARTETTCAQYLPFLQASLAAGTIVVRDSRVLAASDNAVYVETSAATAPTCITWDGSHFGVSAGRENHPVTGVRWIGAAAFGNWYGAQLGLQPCYTLPGGAVNWTVRCIRLPTEAEWEYAARGGQQSPYYDYPWGNQVDDARANWVGSGAPWEQGPQPQPTPACFYDGSLRRRADYAWPSAVETYQTLDGRNAYGLCDAAANVWEWVHDWYARNYYAVSPPQDPPGPTAGDPMPDGLPYHGLRGGDFFNQTTYRGDHSRVSNRDPAYYRGRYLGVDDPNGPWFHIGFRVVLQQR